MANFNWFGATYEDVLKRRKGTQLSDYNSEPGKGDGREVIEKAMDKAETFIHAFLPEDIRKKVERIEGEIVVRKARDRQTAATLGISEGVSSLILYRNPVCRFEMLGEADEMPASAYTHDGSGSIAFTPGLSLGDLVIASYEHGFRSFQLLADTVVDLAVFWLATLDEEGMTDASVEVMFKDYAFSVLRGLCGDGRDFTLTLRELARLQFYTEDLFRKRRGTIFTGRIVRG